MHFVCFINTCSQKYTPEQLYFKLQSSRKGMTIFPKHGVDIQLTYASNWVIDYWPRIYIFIIQVTVCRHTIYSVPLYIPLVKLHDLQKVVGSHSRYTLLNNENEDNFGVFLEKGDFAFLTTQLLLFRNL